MGWIAHGRGGVHMPDQDTEYRKIQLTGLDLRRQFAKRLDYRKRPAQKRHRQC